jgi:hypothetical protein
MIYQYTLIGTANHRIYNSKLGRFASKEISSFCFILLFISISYNRITKQNTQLKTPQISSLIATHTEHIHDTSPFHTMPPKYSTDILSLEFQF